MRNAAATDLPPLECDDNRKARWIENAWFGRARARLEQRMPSIVETAMGLLTLDGRDG
jgi:hypothetical protein